MTFALRTPTPLTDDQLRLAAPSVFTDRPAGAMSDRYAFLPTFEVVRGLRDNGFLPFFARQSTAMSKHAQPFARHEIRFRHVDTIAQNERTARMGVGFLRGTDIVREFDEISLVNSHDGSSAFELYRGVFRVVCTNGLIAATTGGERVRVKHAGNIVDNVIEGATRILADSQRTTEEREAFAALQLDKDEEVAFATAALQLRYNGEPAPIDAPALLQRRREDDRQNDLWTVLNVVQENIVKGGVRGFTPTGRRMTTRGISSITTDIGVNRMLWNLAQAARNMREGLEGVTWEDAHVIGTLDEAVNA